VVNYFRLLKVEESLLELFVPKHFTIPPCYCSTTSSSDGNEARRRGTTAPHVLIASDPLLQDVPTYPTLNFKAFAPVAFPNVESATPRRWNEPKSERSPHLLALRPSILTPSTSPDHLPQHRVHTAPPSPRRPNVVVYGHYHFP